jgi:hypothetical protein
MLNSNLCNGPKDSVVLEYPGYAYPENDISAERSWKRASEVVDPEFSAEAESLVKVIIVYQYSDLAQHLKRDIPGDFRGAVVNQTQDDAQGFDVPILRADFVKVFVGFGSFQPIPSQSRFEDG